MKTKSEGKIIPLTDEKIKNSPKLISITIILLLSTFTKLTNLISIFFHNFETQIAQRRRSSTAGIAVEVSEGATEGAVRRKACESCDGSAGGTWNATLNL